MPTYEYKCKDCGKNFDEFQSIKDKPLKECKFCKGPVKRVIHAAGIVFKGAGFYVTDNGKHGQTVENTPAKTAEKKPAPAPAEKPSTSVNKA